MPTNKNAMTRYKILDELLSDRYHHYSLDDLTEEVNVRLADMYPNTDGVVRRTIEKDIYYLEYEGPFMVDIERYTVEGYNNERQKPYSKLCLRYEQLSFSIFKKDMTSDEKHLLREALSLLGQFDGLPNLEALEGLRLSLGVRDKERKIISFSKNPLEGSNLLGELFTAISQRLVVELHYHTFSNQEKALKVNLFPYLLKEYNRRWYLIAASEKDHKMLNFALDRVDEVVTLPSHKYVDYDGDLNERFEDIIGVTLYEESPLYPIVFWVSDASKDYVLTKPLHESQKNIPDKRLEEYRRQYPMLEGGRFFEIECKYNYELIRELSSFGKDLIVFKPTEIQDKIKQRIYEMNQCYKEIK